MIQDQQETLNETFLGKEDPDMAFKREIRKVEIPEIDAVRGLNIHAQPMTKTKSIQLSYPLYIEGSEPARVYTQDNHEWVEGRKAYRIAIEEERNKRIDLKGNTTYHQELKKRNAKTLEKALKIIEEDRV